MEEATLGGIPGRGVAHVHEDSGVRAVSGVFEYERQHAPAVNQLFNSGDFVEFEGLIGGKRQRVKAIITGMPALGGGAAKFEGSGAPYQ